MRKIFAALIALLFFALAFFKLNQDEVPRSSLIREYGEIESVKCNSDSRDGAPTLFLVGEGGAKSYKVLEDFSHRTKCDSQLQNLIGSSVEVSILENQHNFAFAYEVILDGKLIYTVEDVVSSDNETAYLSFAVGFLCLIFMFGKVRKSN